MATAMMYLVALTVNAAADSLLPVWPDGPPMAGHDAIIEVLVSNGPDLVVGDEEPIILARHGNIIERHGEHSPGRWRFTYRAAGSGEPDRLTISTDAAFVEWDIQPNDALREQPLSISGRRSGSAQSAEPFVFTVDGVDELRSDQLQFTASEGVLAVEEREGDQRPQLRYEHAGLVFQRPVIIGVRDVSSPGAPAWAVISLRTVYSVPIQTAPNSTVEVQVGQRDYGPFTADEFGNVTLTLETRPGESVAQVFARDERGNEVRTSFDLGGSAKPVLAGLVEGSLHPELPPPVVHFYGVRPDGRPWRGSEALSCVGDDGRTLRAVSTERGRWEVPFEVPNEPVEAVSVSCTLAGQAYERVEIPLGKLPPNQMFLRVEPLVLNADQPDAQVRVYTENLLGERAPATSLSLRAEHGHLRSTSAGSYLSATYDGSDAVLHRRDTLTATWSRSTSREPVWQLEPFAAAHGDIVELGARALDRHGDVVEGALVSIQLGQLEVSAETDSRGRLSVDFPSPEEEAMYFSVSTSELVRARALLPGESFGAAGPLVPELEASEVVRVSAGTVRGMFVTTEPRIIAAESGVARIEVRPVDKNGNPVLDEEIHLLASEGRLSMVEPEPDGSYFSTYSAPTGVDSATIEITASTADGGYSATTDLTILPMVSNHMLNLSLGPFWSERSVGLTSWFAARYSRAFYDPLSIGTSVYTLWGHIDIGGYPIQFEGTDEQAIDGSSGEPAFFALRSFINTSGLGASVRRQHRFFSTFAGFTVTPNVSWKSVLIGDKEVARGWSLSTDALLGGLLYIGGSRQVRGGEWELRLQAFSLNQTTQTVGWQGQVGGFSVVGGYNFLF